MCDFGLSQLFEKGQKIMDEKRPKGTPLYMAPEVWLGREFNEKADVYRCALFVGVVVCCYCLLLMFIYVALELSCGSCCRVNQPLLTTRRSKSSR